METTVRRNPLACLACRQAKSKCDGALPTMLMDGSDVVPATKACSRCTMHGVQCAWKPCSRTGRPPKRKAALEQSLESSELPSLGQADLSLLAYPFDCEASLGIFDALLDAHAEPGPSSQPLSQPSCFSSSPSSSSSRSSAVSSSFAGTSPTSSVASQLREMKRRMGSRRDEDVVATGCVCLSPYSMSAD